ncbi:MAG: hypothetical protein J3K34DRAFT_447431 [Monoraphidium minutum]|nr:MAG: hypothetical protein J3K34DRAFT_447431 [Monoraphidium minutum]
MAHLTTCASASAGLLLWSLMMTVAPARLAATSCRSAGTRGLPWRNTRRLPWRSRSGTARLKMSSISSFSR